MRQTAPVGEWHKQLYAAAIRLLARREHSADELRQKLAARRLPEDTDPARLEDLIEQVLQVLQQQGLQSDRRFAESYARLRIQKGYGPQRIDNELRERGVSASIRAEVLQSLERDGEVDWQLLMRRVREKKFGSVVPDDYAARSRQMRFLQYRGFAGEQIMALLSEK